MPTFYPTLTHETITFLDTIKGLADKDPDYFGKSCPYPASIKQLFAKNIAEKVILEEDTGDKWENLEREILALAKKMKDEELNFGDMTQAERLSWGRTMTQLYEKLVGLAERAVGVTRVADFVNTVMDIFEGILETDQKADVMDRLRAAINQKGSK